MSRILCLAPSGFGKTAGIGKEPDLDLEGLPTKKTYIISVTSKPLTFGEGHIQYPITTNLKLLSSGRRIISNNAGVIAQAMIDLHKTPIQFIVWDDANYVMQDYFMKMALKTGWDTPKKIGYDMYRIFEAM